MVRRRKPRYSPIGNFGTDRGATLNQNIRWLQIKVKYFEGTPIPTSILLVALMAVAAWSDALRQNLWFGEVRLAGLILHPLVLLFALSGSLMISRLHVPKP